MTRIPIRLLCWLTLCGSFFALSPQVFAQDEEPILDTYLVGQISSTWDRTEGFTAHVRDPNLGNGTARTELRLQVGQTAATLKLQASRRVRPGQIVFALLVDRVEVRVRNLAGEVIAERTLPGFIFGDSASGRWQATLRDLPANTAVVEVTFFGNYE
ncbi:MAG: hypothetical protein RMM51_00145 [Verrucomicrobiae bacterium]|nr:hypothetical protein [Verrucomicrobiae bacterium]